MKYFHSSLVRSAVFLAALVFAADFAGAQPGLGPQLNGAIAKLFGDHKSFSATVEMQMDAGPAGPMSMTGSMAFLEGMSRFEMDMSKVSAASMPPQALEQMKRMGMDKMVTISIPDKKTVRMIYPNMKAYVEMQVPDASGAASDKDYKVETTELGSETVNGHPCVKNKMKVTGPDGVAHEATVWNATDLSKFPAKIEMTENGSKATMLFKDVKLEKPDAAQFNAPSGYKKYDDITSLMTSRARPN